MSVTSDAKVFITCFEKPDTNSIEKEQEVKDYILSQCTGKDICNVNIPNSLLTYYPHEYGMTLFAQVACTQTSEMIEKKNVIGLVIACLSLMICLYMRLRVSYMHNLDTINNKLIDGMLLTVDDFTVSGKLAPEIY